MRKRRRFTPEFKAQVVLDVLIGRQSPAEACRTHALSPNLLSLWKAHFLQRAHTLFQADEQREGDQARVAELERMLGRATLQIEAGLQLCENVLPSRVWKRGPVDIRVRNRPERALVSLQPPIRRAAERQTQRVMVQVETPNGSP